MHQNPKMCSLLFAWSTLVAAVSTTNAGATPYSTTDARPTSVPKAKPVSKNGPRPLRPCRRLGKFPSRSGSGWTSAASSTGAGHGVAVGPLGAAATATASPRQSYLLATIEEVAEEEAEDEEDEDDARGSYLSSSSDECGTESTRSPTKAQSASSAGTASTAASPIIVPQREDPPPPSPYPESPYPEFCMRLLDIACAGPRAAPGEGAGAGVEAAPSTYHPSAPQVGPAYPPQLQQVQPAVAEDRQVQPAVQNRKNDKSKCRRGRSWRVDMREPQRQPVPAGELLLQELAGGKGHGGRGGSYSCTPACNMFIPATYTNSCFDAAPALASNSKCYLHQEDGTLVDMMGTGGQLPTGAQHHQLHNFIPQEQQLQREHESQSSMIMYYNYYGPLCAAGTASTAPPEGYPCGAFGFGGIAGGGFNSDLNNMGGWGAVMDDLQLAVARPQNVGPGFLACQNQHFFAQPETGGAPPQEDFTPAELECIPDASHMMTLLGYAGQAGTTPTASLPSGEREPEHRRDRDRIDFDSEFEVHNRLDFVVAPGDGLMMSGDLHGKGASNPLAAQQLQRLPFWWGAPVVGRAGACSSRDSGFSGNRCSGGVNGLGFPGSYEYVMHAVYADLTPGEDAGVLKVFDPSREKMVPLELDLEGTDVEVDHSGATRCDLPQEPPHPSSLSGNEEPQPLQEQLPSAEADPEDQDEEFDNESAAVAGVEVAAPTPPALHPAQEVEIQLQEACAHQVEAARHLAAEAEQAEPVTNDKNSRDPEPNTGSRGNYFQRKRRAETTVEDGGTAPAAWAHLVNPHSDSNVNECAGRAEIDDDGSTGSPCSASPCGSQDSHSFSGELLTPGEAQESNLAAALAVHEPDGGIESGIRQQQQRGVCARVVRKLWSAFVRRARKSLPGRATRRASRIVRKASQYFAVFLQVCYDEWHGFVRPGDAEIVSMIGPASSGSGPSGPQGGKGNKQPLLQQKRSKGVGGGAAVASSCSGAAHTGSSTTASAFLASSQRARGRGRTTPEEAAVMRGLFQFAKRHNLSLASTSRACTRSLRDREQEQGGEVGQGQAEDVVIEGESSEGSGANEQELLLQSEFANLRYQHELQEKQNEIKRQQRAQRRRDEEALKALEEAKLAEMHRQEAAEEASPSSLLSSWWGGHRGRRSSKKSRLDESRDDDSPEKIGTPGGAAAAGARSGGKKNNYNKTTADRLRDSTPPKGFITDTGIKLTGRRAWVASMMRRAAPGAAAVAPSATKSTRSDHVPQVENEPQGGGLQLHQPVSRERKKAQGSSPKWSAGSPPAALGMHAPASSATCSDGEPGTSSDGGGACFNNPNHAAALPLQPLSAKIPRISALKLSRGGNATRKAPAAAEDSLKISKEDMGARQQRIAKDARWKEQRRLQDEERESFLRRLSNWQNKVASKHGWQLSRIFQGALLERKKQDEEHEQNLQKLSGEVEHRVKDADVEPPKEEPSATASSAQQKNLNQAHRGKTGEVEVLQLSPSGSGGGGGGRGRKSKRIQYRPYLLHETPAQNQIKDTSCWTRKLVPDDDHFECISSTVADRGLAKENSSPDAGDSRADGSAPTYAEDFSAPADQDELHASVGPHEDHGATTLLLDEILAGEQSLAASLEQLNMGNTFVSAAIRRDATAAFLSNSLPFILSPSLDDEPSPGGGPQVTEDGQRYLDPTRSSSCDRGTTSAATALRQRTFFRSVLRYWKSFRPDVFVTTGRAAAEAASTSSSCGIIGNAPGKVVIRLPVRQVDKTTKSYSVHRAGFALLDVLARFRLVLPYHADDYDGRGDDVEAEGSGRAMLPYPRLSCEKRRPRRSVHALIASLAASEPEPDDKQEGSIRIPASGRQELATEADHPEVLLEHPSLPLRHEEVPAFALPPSLPSSDHNLMDEESSHCHTTDELGGLDGKTDEDRFVFDQGYSSSYGGLSTVSREAFHRSAMQHMWDSLDTPLDDLLALYPSSPGASSCSSDGRTTAGRTWTVPLDVPPARAAVTEQHKKDRPVFGEGPVEDLLSYLVSVPVEVLVVFTAGTTADPPPAATKVQETVRLQLPYWTTLIEVQKHALDRVMPLIGRGCGRDDAELDLDQHRELQKLGLVHSFRWKKERSGKPQKKWVAFPDELPSMDATLTDLSRSTGGTQYFEMEADAILLAAGT